MTNSNGNRAPTEYERKFADFILMLVETREEVILIHHPQVIGDNYDEIRSRPSQRAVGSQ